MQNLCEKADVVFIQETWLEEWECNFVNDAIPNFMGRAFSGMEESREVRKGRPFGGIGIMWRKEIVSGIENVKCLENRRIMTMK